MCFEGPNFFHSLRSVNSLRVKAIPESLPAMIASHENACNNDVNISH